MPENRLRAYDVHHAIDSVADVGSVLELRADYGVGVVTALVRVEGVAFGLLANSSHHLGGAIDAEAADKMADFLTLCESVGLPIISLCDTPGFMVGPDAEVDAAVRRFSRLFIVGARLTVPFGMVILRKGYGLGAMAMAGGSFHAPEFTVAWPTGEIGGMGLEGAVRLGFSKELAAVADPIERQNLFDKLVEAAYQHGKALTSATTFELDDVIDPADTRAWITRLLSNERRESVVKVADKVAIVTGGGNGIGAALAAKLAHQDARVVVADINSHAADAVAERINADGPGAAVASGGDVSDTAHIQQLIALAENEFGPVDLYFANAGITGVVGPGRHRGRMGPVHRRQPAGPHPRRATAGARHGSSAARATSSAPRRRPGCSPNSVRRPTR